MTHSSRRPVAAALLLSAAFAFAAPAAAVPTSAVTARARLIEPHVPLTASRASGGTFVVHYAAAPPFALHSAPAEPLKPLPLIAPPVPVRAVPAFLPRLGLAALPALADVDECAAPRSGVLLSALPATPFAPIACQRDLSGPGARDVPTSLVPGHDKNALYGSGYSPRSLENL